MLVNSLGNQTILVNNLSKKVFSKHKVVFLFEEAEFKKKFSFQYPTGIVITNFILKRLFKSFILFIY